MVPISNPARFSAPVEIGGLQTADPLDPQVQAW
jgi:alpha-glucuronidase